LVAFRLDNFIISITACFYAWLDFANNTYQNSLCEGFYRQIIGETDKDVIDRKYKFFVIFSQLLGVGAHLFFFGGAVVAEGVVVVCFVPVFLQDDCHCVGLILNISLYIIILYPGY
jgi:hypothetical protein